MYAKRIELEQIQSDTIKSVLKKISHYAGTSGQPVYLVGGSVRDILLHRPLTDLDFVVPDDGIAFATGFARSLGIHRVVSYENYGTAMIPYPNLNLEFVGARAESYHSDSRNPRVTRATLEEDLHRRDFTINAMAIRLTPGSNKPIIDIFNGLADLADKTLRTPLEPEQTFFDDPLRILRAVRFASQLHFTIAAETFASMRKMADRLAIISVERINTELTKILMSSKPSIGLELMAQSNILTYVIPEMLQLQVEQEQDGKSHKDIFAHTLKVVDMAATKNADLETRLACLLHDIGKPATRVFDPEKGWTFHKHAAIGAEMSKTILQRLRYSAKITDTVCLLVRHHNRPGSLAKKGITDSAVRRLLYDVGDDIERLLLLSSCDVTSKIDGRYEEIQKNIEKLGQRLQAIETKDKLRHFHNPVSGLDIMNIFAVKEGKLIGVVKEAVKEAIIEGHIQNDKNEALAYIRQNMAKWEQLK
jgi:poly(A) polymerase